MPTIINGIQQIGIGVADAKQVFDWYRKHLGFDILVFEDVAPAHLMTRYTDGKIQKRLALLALNLGGGGGLEIWQFKDRKPRPAEHPLQLGDLGVNVMKIRSRDMVKVHEHLKSLDQKPHDQKSNHYKSLEPKNAQGTNDQEVTDLKTGDTKSQDLGHGVHGPSAIYDSSHFFFTDPWLNRFEVVQDDFGFTHTPCGSGGVLGALIGVSDMEVSLNFYRNLLGYNVVASDRQGIFEDFFDLPGGEGAFRRVLLKHDNRPVGGFGELYGPSQIELVQALDRRPHPMYKDRIWGDLGYIHLCFDVRGMDGLRDEAEELGHPFTVDSADSFDMGDAAGRFGYVEDPDGTLIELVETHRVPIFKRFGVYIDLKQRHPLKPLPKWLVRMMRVHRVRG